MIRKALERHRCAVCWEYQPTHDDWFKHAETRHGSALRPFDYDVCEHDGLCRSGCHEHIPDCPGLNHAQRLKQEGTPPKRKPAPEPKPVRGHDGHVYTPVRLPLDADADAELLADVMRCMGGRCEHGVEDHS